jgi:hypothetical protein
MASFIHIADRDREQAILRNGIRSIKRRSGLNGVYAMPVLPDFATTHQWARELRRRPIRAHLCVQFKISDEDRVFVGKYNGEKLEMTAAEAVSTVLAHADPMGVEILIPRKIDPDTHLSRSASHRMEILPFGEGKPPFCHCKWCNRGEIRAQRLIRED